MAFAQSAFAAGASRSRRQGLLPAVLRPRARLRVRRRVRLALRPPPRLCKRAARMARRWQPPIPGAPRQEWHAGVPESVLQSPGPPLRTTYRADREYFSGGHAERSFRSQVNYVYEYLYYDMSGTVLLANNEGEDSADGRDPGHQPGDVVVDHPGPKAPGEAGQRGADGNCAPRERAQDREAAPVEGREGGQDRAGHRGEGGGDRGRPRLANRKGAGHRTVAA